MTTAVSQGRCAARFSKRSEDEQQDAQRGQLPPYSYTPKHHWAVKLHFLSGITLLPWLRLLVRHWAAIDWLSYPHRVLFLSCMAVLNSLLALLDWLLFSRAVASQPLHPEPLFILGHPRTGTTHLHNLLARDPWFAAATTFHAGFPSSFLCLEPARWLLGGLLERRRPMDHMSLHWDLPAEDEIAVNTLTGGDSPYLALVFPRLWRSLLRSYLTFGASAADGEEDAGEEAAAASSDPRVTAAFQRWLAAFLWFMRKVTYRYVRSRRNTSSSSSSKATSASGSAAGCCAPDCGASSSTPPPLLIKSPVHTARLATWLRLFPRARFIYVHRHPLEVFQSAAHMADTYYWYTYLQRPTDNHTNDFIMDQYELMYRSYMADRGRVPAGRLVEVAFADLDSDPMGVMQRIYREFGWEERFEAVRPAVQGYLGSLEDFKKNHFNRLSPEVEAVVRQRWADSFKAFGYT